MTRLLSLLILLLALAAPLHAQETEAESRDRSFLSDLIEDNLSSVSRQVLIDGFRGALSSQATIRRLSIADANGVWLIAEDLVLDWNRSALLGGALEINTLSAGRIAILRPPLPDPDPLIVPEASPFALPNLPVSVRIGELTVARIDLGAPVLGEAVALSLTGTAELAGGTGSARVTAQRIDGAEGRFLLSGSYSNTTRILELTADLTEAADGIVARLLDLPGRPSLQLAISGVAPIDDYQAQLTLDTDGVRRVAGAFGQLRQEPAGELAFRQFSLSLAGDVTPLLAPDFASFLGPESRILAEGRLVEDGTLILTSLEVSARALSLTGAAELAPGGWPRLLQLDGVIGNDNGSPVVLPGGGGTVTVTSAALSVAYDRRTDDAWTGSFALTGLALPTVSVPQITLEGGGTIRPAEGDSPGAFLAALDYAATGLAFADPGLSSAIGPEARGTLRLARDNDGPFRIEQLTLTGPGLAVEISGTIDGPSLAFRTRTSTLLTADRLARFAPLIGLALEGSAQMSIISDIMPLSGAFEAILSGQTQDLAVGNAAADPYLGGAGRLSATIIRDTAGLRAEDVAITTPQLSGTAAATLTSGASSATFDLTLADAGLALPGLSGPVTLRGTATRGADGASRIVADAALPGVEAAFLAEITPAGDGSGQARIIAADLAAFRGLTGLDLSGAARLIATGAMPAAGGYRVTLGGGTTGLALGIAQIDPLLAGEGRIAAHLSDLPGGGLDAQGIEVMTAALSLTGAAQVTADGIAATFRAGLADLTGVLPGVGGAATATGTVALSPDGVLALNLTATGPGAARATIESQTDTAQAGLPTTARADLEVDDLRPWGALAGQRLSGGLSAALSGTLTADGQAFDLRLDARARDLDPGVPQLARLLAGDGTLAGQFSRSGGRGITIDALALRFANLSANLSLSGTGGAGQASFDARLADIGLFTPDFSGPVTATGTARRQATGVWTLDTRATGPGGTAATISGTVTEALGLGLRVLGSAPLGLINGLIEPRRITGTASFDLSVTGPPALTSVAGTVRLAGGRVSDPSLRAALSDLAGTIRLAAGRAVLDLSARLDSGGAITIGGGLGLAAPYLADLRIGLVDLVVRDPALYQTTASGTVTLSGALAGGARIAGQIDLGPTEVQVPSSGVGALGPLPPVIHVNPSAEVLQTLARAGLTDQGRAVAGAVGRAAYPLDLLIRAPARVFVRGRGLDAELGGELRLTGTTADVITAGQFDLIRGRLDILQQRFVLSEGSVSLQGGFIPMLRLVARTEARTGTEIDIIIDGPATEPQVIFQSRPELPQDQVLAQLVFGRDLTTITPLQAVQLAAAVGTLAGRGGGGVIAGLRQGIGLDDFDIAQDAEGNAALRAGKYLTDNIYTDVTISQAETEINLNFDITADITATGTVSTSGETSLGVFFERDY